MKQPGLDTKYAYAVGRIRVLETRLLGGSAFEAILEREDLKSSVRALSEYDTYARFSESMQEPVSREIAFSDETLSTYNLIYGMAEEKALISPFFEKLNMMTKPAEVKAQALDRHIWAFFRGAWGENFFLSEYVKIAVDLENIKIFFRVKIKGRNKKFLEDALIPGGTMGIRTILELFEKTMEEAFTKIGRSRYRELLIKGFEEYNDTGKISPLERICDDFLTDYIKAAKYYPFGAEPLVSYILAKENEIKNLRMILAGKENGFAPEALRGILRKSYV